MTTNNLNSLSDFKIIDIHAHLGSYFQFPIRLNKTEDIVNTIKKLNIKKILVSHMFSFLYDAEEGNSLTLKEAGKYPDLFLSGGVLDPRWDENKIEEEFNRINSHVSMWNELHPALHYYSLNGSGYRVILDLIKLQPKPVLFHTDESDRFSKPAQLKEIIPLYPEIPFIIGHSGNVIGGFETAVEIVKKYDNAFLDSTFSRNYMGIIKWIIDKVSANKILFGSDIPFLNGAAQVGKLFEPGITETEREKIFYNNAVKLLNTNSFLVKPA